MKGEIESERKKFSWGKNLDSYIPGRCTINITIVIAMLLLIHELGKYIGRYKHTKSQEKINPLMYMNDIKLLTKNYKKWKSL